MTESKDYMCLECGLFYIIPDGTMPAKCDSPEGCGGTTLTELTEEDWDRLEDNDMLELSPAMKKTIAERMQQLAEGKVLSTKQLRQRLKEHREALAREKGDNHENRS